MSETEQSGGKEAVVRTIAKPMVEVYERWCKGCGVCIEFCPTQALAMDEDRHAYLAAPDKCTTCGMCELRCPDFAITVIRRPRRRRS